MTRAPLIAVCGPIGAGKSTLVAALAAKLGRCARSERVAANPFFERYLADRERYAFWSQLAFVLGAVHDASVVREAGGGVLERPAQEMLGVFAAFLSERGYLGESERSTLEQVVRTSERLVGTPDMFIMLHAQPHQLMGRLAERGDLGDNFYDLGEMIDLARAYECWRATLDKDRTIDVDVEADDLRDPIEMDKLVAKVESTLERL